MIQRIQSVYLFIAAIATIILLFIPIGYVYTDLYGFEFNVFVVKDLSPEGGTFMGTFYLAILLIASAITSIVAIFMYKDRVKQVKVVYANMCIYLMSILIMLYIYPDVIFMRKGLMQTGDIFQYNYWVLACIVPIAFCLYMANRSIKNDEKKVRAADRLR